MSELKNREGMLAAALDNSLDHALKLQGILHRLGAEERPLGDGELEKKNPIPPDPSVATQIEMLLGIQSRIAGLLEQINATVATF